MRFVEGGKPFPPLQSVLSSNFNSNDQMQRCASVKESDSVNTHITAPPALLALALMFLKSNNKELSDKITLPNSFSSIETCNPNHILLKTVTKNLIMWDSIKNTQ